MKNAKQNVMEVCSQLMCAKNELTQALRTVEKETNKRQINTTLAAVENAISAANNTIANYQEK